MSDLVGRLVLLASLLVWLFSGGHANAEDCLPCPANKQLALAYIDRLAHNDIDGATALATDNARFWLSGPGEMDKRGFKDFLSPFVQMILNMQLQVVSLTAEDDRIAAEVQGIAELRNGKTYRNRYVFMFTARGGKLLAVKEYSDSAPARVTFKSE